MSRISWFLFALCMLLSGCQQNRDSSPQTAISFVGGEACASCHQEQHDLWSESHHDLAMQSADADTVLGDFDNVSFRYFGVTSKFFRRDGNFFVNTDGPDGNLEDYEIKYTFGVTPLQQYLIEFPGGRMQALSVAWDSRPKKKGGQRWFHLYPDEEIKRDDVLHWTGLGQNWNHMCAECHSTNYKKNYGAKADAFNPVWSEIDVACEACHGPGSDHVAWAKQESGWKKLEPTKGLEIGFNERTGIAWRINPETGTAQRSQARSSSREIELCARCHSRRASITQDYRHGQPLLDTHMLSLLEERLYHADGQIKDEVYVYGSFIQSKMYHQGVTCSDCHEPHSLKLRAAGGAVCAQCHLPKKFASPVHHFHQPGSEGASCVDCHMPETKYMVIDPRRDHSIRIPRPDLSVKLGTPNACNQCHADQTPRWAATIMQKWYGKNFAARPHIAEALHAGRTGQANAEQLLMQLTEESSAPTIARATALTHLGRRLSPSSLGVAQRALAHPDPLLRVAAVQALEALESSQRLQPAYGLLNDPIRSVRIETARVLADVPPKQLSDSQRAALEKGIAEYIDAQQANADRPEAHLNLGLLYVRRGELAQAEAAYRTAMRLQPSFVPAYVNLADLYRLQQRDREGEALLHQAIKRAPDQADAYHALGLLLARRKQMDQAVAALKQAATLRPDSPRYAYIYAVALNSTGKPKTSIKVLQDTQRRHPHDRDILFALVTIHRDQRDINSAIRYAEKLVAIAPQDPSVQQLLNQLRSQRDRKQ